MQALNHLSVTVLVFVLVSGNLVWCNPLAYDGLSAPLFAIPSVPMPMPMMMGPHQFDPYAAMSIPGPYMMAPPFNPATQSSRRSHREKPQSDNDDKDEQKALDGLPVSFIEPDPPSSISERISDSFSALGEGVRNHFKSLTENFSDTMDDIKEAWRPSSSATTDGRKRRANLSV